MSAPHATGRLGRAAASEGLVLVLAGVALAGAASGPLTFVAVVVAVVVHGVGLVRARTELIPVTVVGLVVAFVSAHGTDVGADTAAPFAAGLLLAAELAWWAAERTTPMVAERGVDLPRWCALAGMAVGALVVGYGVFLVASARVPGGALTEIAAIGAVIAVLVLARGLLRRPAPDR